MECVREDKEGLYFQVGSGIKVAQGYGGYIKLRRPLEVAEVATFATFVTFATLSNLLKI